MPKPTDLLVILNLAQLSNNELNTARYGDGDEIPGIVTSGGDDIATIRLGLDYIASPNIPKPSEITSIDKALRTRLGNRAWASVEVGLEQLVVYFSKIQLEDYCKEEWPRLGANVFSEVDGITSTLEREIRETLWHVYTAGTHVGREDGQNFIRALYGKTPATSKVYRFKSMHPETLLTAPKPGVDVDALCLHIRVESQDMRDKRHRTMFFKQRKHMVSIEKGINDVLKDRVRLTLGDSVQSCVESLRNLQKDMKYLQSQVWDAVFNAYDISKFDRGGLGSLPGQGLQVHILQPLYFCQGQRC